MKAGDLVERTGHTDNGTGVVLDFHDADTGVCYIEVYWPALGEPLWYDQIELRVISESR